MRKNAMVMTLATLVLSVFGAFLRWLQTKNIFEAETGLAIPHAPLSIIFVIYSVLVVFVIVAAVLLWLRRYRAEHAAGKALRSESRIPVILSWVLALVFVVASLFVMFTAESGRFPMMQRIFGACGIFGGLCIPFFLAKPDGTASASSRGAAVILPFFYLFWMVFSYKTNADNPVLWEFAPEIVALAAGTIGVYQVAAYFYDRAKPMRALVALQMAAYFNVTVLFDHRAFPMTMLIAVSAALMLLLNFVLIANLWEGD